MKVANSNKPHTALEQTAIDLVQTGFNSNTFHPALIVHTTLEQPTMDSTK